MDKKTKYKLVFAAVAAVLAAVGAFAPAEVADALLALSQLFAGE